MTPATFAAALASLGLTQIEFARLTDLDNGTVSRWVRGVLPVPLWAERLLDAWKVTGVPSDEQETRVSRLVTGWFVWDLIDDFVWDMCLGEVYLGSVYPEGRKWRALSGDGKLLGDFPKQSDARDAVVLAGRKTIGALPSLRLACTEMEEPGVPGEGEKT